MKRAGEELVSQPAKKTVTWSLPTKNDNNNSSMAAAASASSTTTAAVDRAPPQPTAPTPPTPSRAGHFTFDFMDDRSTAGSSSSFNHHISGSATVKRSPRSITSDRLDSRYSARLVSPSKSSYSDISRNLFDAPCGPDNSSSNDCDRSSSAMSIDDQWSTPQRTSNYNSSNFASPSNSIRSNSTNRSYNTYQQYDGRSVDSFLSASSSPRKRTSVITGVASPMSDIGPSSLAASLASSLNVSPTRSSTSTVATTDRFIPSRASSNFNFTLKTGTGRHNPIRASTHFTHGDNSTTAAGGDGSPSGNNNNNTDIAPSESFGATLVGGTPVIDETATTAGGAGGGTDTTTPDVDATFSDDGDQDSSERHDLVHRQPLLYDALLRSEMLGENIDPAARQSMHSGIGMNNYSTSHHGNGALSPFRERSNNLSFVSPYHAMNTVVTYDHDVNRRESEHQSIVGSFNLSPVSSMGRQRMPRFTDRCKRKIAKVPTKVLDAPSLQDDFYLNLVDWSSQNVLAVGLGNCVYLWSAATSKVTQLCDLSDTEDVVTSVAWSEGGRHLAVGSSRGEVQLWDASNQKLIRVMGGHSARIGALSWKQNASGGAPSAGSSSLLASGSRDRLIHLRDPRSESAYEMRLCAHKQEVCGLKWSFDERSMLASGGNDNKLLVWDIKKHTSPVHSFGDHTAAVKAITWSPHQHGLLASGGGTADRCIRFWNCLTGNGINCIDTGSQVCNLAWSKNCNEIVSTHGYSLNQIVVWKYPSMQKIATLTGHTYRVLYLAVSPDGSTIVTGAGDETLRFWQVFPGPQKENKAGGLLFPAGMPGSVIR